MLGYSGATAITAEGSGVTAVMVCETSGSLTRTDFMVKSGQTETRELLMVSL